MAKHVLILMGGTGVFIFGFSWLLLYFEKSDLIQPVTSGIVGLLGAVIGFMVRGITER